MRRHLCRHGKAAPEADSHLSVPYQLSSRLLCFWSAGWGLRRCGRALIMFCRLAGLILSPLLTQVCSGVRRSDSDERVVAVARVGEQKQLRVVGSGGAG
jgi:hypothetical protein